MIKDFSNGYYAATMTIQPLSSGPSIEKGLYDIIDSRFYEDTDTPVTMRLGLDSDGTHFRPEPEGAMPTNVLGLPQSMLDQMKVHPSAEDVTVLILKPGHAEILSEPNTDLPVPDETLSQRDREFFNLDEYNL